MEVKVLGLDTAKNVFQVHGADASGRVVLRKRLRRAQISDFFANLPKCVVGSRHPRRRIVARLYRTSAGTSAAATFLSGDPAGSEEDPY